MYMYMYMYMYIYMFDGLTAPGIVPVMQMNTEPVSG